MTSLNLSVNGRRYEVEAEPRRTLADVLRDDLGLHGTHLGCEHGVCGACTVLVDGAPTRACLIFAVQCQSSSITTVEGWPATEHSIRCSARSSTISGCNVDSAPRAS